MSEKTVIRAAGAISSAVVVALVLSSCTVPPSDERPSVVPEVSTPDIKQAKWHIRIAPTGAVDKTTRAEAKLIQEQRPRLRQVVSDVYDALFLFPSRRGATVRKYFVPKAARLVLNSHTGVSPHAQSVKTWARRATIGIQPDGARRAAAKVFIRLEGELRGRTFRLLHTGTLWLERVRHLWKIIGFEVRQQPVRRGTHQSDRQRKGTKRKGDGSGKRSDRWQRKGRNDKRRNRNS